jgi:hypothetical protein
MISTTYGGHSTASTTALVTFFMRVCSCFCVHMGYRLMSTIGMPVSTVVLLSLATHLPAAWAVA